MVLMATRSVVRPQQQVIVSFLLLKTCWCEWSRWNLRERVSLAIVLDLAGRSAVTSGTPEEVWDDTER